jgi:hypothetical protein
MRVEYLLKENIVLRHATPYVQELDVYSLVRRRWRPYTVPRRDLQFVEVLTPEEARRELRANGASATEASRAVPED